MSYSTSPLHTTMPHEYQCCTTHVGTQRYLRMSFTKSVPMQVFTPDESVYSFWPSLQLPCCAPLPLTSDTTIALYAALVMHMLRASPYTSRVPSLHLKRHSFRLARFSKKASLVAASSPVGWLQ